MNAIPRTSGESLLSAARVAHFWLLATVPHDAERLGVEYGLLLRAMRETAAELEMRALWTCANEALSQRPAVRA